jgi:hypothetical protein
LLTRRKPAVTKSHVTIHVGYNIIVKLKKILQEKAVEATKQKGEKRGKTKPEEREGMPPRQHCPPEKRRGDRNQECHAERQEDVAMNSRRTSPKKRRNGTQVVRRTKCCIRT